ncbi:MAG: hypothetical protein KGL96_06230 [Hyphomicrobiales bacterium]|nr:hypothetical protein [Hyphomicrobiales bacterium]MDE2373809.1 hypothetical protein [Hyphomicrobiales bacterium]
MFFVRVVFVACGALLATFFSSAAFAGCCGGCGGCGGSYIVGYTYAPAIPVPPPVVYAPAPAPIAIAPAPIAVDHWDTGGWGGWGGWGNNWGGCGCCCNRGLFTSGAFVTPGPVYIVNQGPQYSGPGIMIPSLGYAPGEGVAGPGTYPYVGPYHPHAYYGYHPYRHRYYYHGRYPLHSRG